VRLPPYDPEVSVGDTVKPKGGDAFVRAPGQPRTATVLAVRLYNCPMEGPEWMADTTAGEAFTFALERVA
jgi:hypothetical protein